MDTVPQIEVTELLTRLNQGEKLHMIDVREDEEVIHGMIPGAVHIPMNDIPERITEVTTAPEVILICRSGYRSERVCEYLQHLGIEGAVNMSGGMLAWNNISGPTQLPS